MYAGGYTLCVALYARGRGWRTLFAGDAPCAALFAGGVRGAGDVGGDAPCAVLDAGGCGGCALFAGGVGGAGGAGGDALYATLYAGGCGGWDLCAGGVGGTEVPEGGGDAVCAALEGELCLLEAPEAMRCMLLCILEAVEGWICVREVLEVWSCRRAEVMRCMRLWRVALFAGGAGLAGGDALFAALYARGCGERALVVGRVEAFAVLEMLGVTRRVRLCMLEAVEVSSVRWRCWR